MQTRRGVARRHGQRGYYLVALTLSLPFIVGAAGLAIDIGRMYITKSEAQGFVDAGALSALVQLDGTATGVALAQAAVRNNPKRWGFGINPFTGVQTSFATASTGPWTATPPNPPTGYNFVQVAVTVNLPMYLLGAFTSQGTSTIAAVAVAGRNQLTQLAGGEFPFSPYTRAASPDNASDPYGMKIGNQYTLLWGSPGDRSTCGTDATQPNLSLQGSYRGYCCVAQSGANVRQAIVSGATDPIAIGQVVHGAINSGTLDVAQRVVLDSDPTSTTYAAYRSLATGNGERVVVVPVNGGAPTYSVLGFAGFFLLDQATYRHVNGNDAICAEYIGAWVQGGFRPPPGGAGAYSQKLFQ